MAWWLDQEKQVQDAERTAARQDGGWELPRGTPRVSTCWYIEMNTDEDGEIY